MVAEMLLAQSGAEIRRMAGILRREGLLAAFGAGGAAQLRFLREAIVAVLRADGPSIDWRLVEVHPEREPLHGLAAALLGSGLLDGLIRGVEKPEQGRSQPALINWLTAEFRRDSAVLAKVLRLSAQRRAATVSGARPIRTLVLLDPFAEISADAADEAQRRATADMVDLLLATQALRDTNLSVALSMKAADLGRCARHERLAGAVNRGFVLLPMVEVAGEAPAAAPAAAAGPAVAGDLAADIVRAAAGLEQATAGQRRATASVRSALPEVAPEPVAGVGEHRTEPAAAHADHRPRPADATAAEAAFQRLAPARQLLAQRMFRAIVTRSPLDAAAVSYEPAPETVATVAAWIGLADWRDLLPVVTAFAERAHAVLDCGAMPRADSVLGFADAGLIGTWERLRVWADDERARAEAYLYAARRMLRFRAEPDAHRLLKVTELQRVRRLFKAASPLAATFAPDAPWALRYAGLAEGAVFGDVVAFVTASQRVRRAELNAQIDAARSGARRPAAGTVREAGAARADGHTGTAPGEAEGVAAAAAAIEAEAVETHVSFSGFRTVGKRETEETERPTLEVQRKATRLDLVSDTGRPAANMPAVSAPVMAWATQANTAATPPAPRRNVSMWLVGALTVAALLGLGFELFGDAFSQPLPRFSLGR